jgi:hypothetical protein
LRVAVWVSPVHIAAIFAASFAGLGWMALAFGVSHLVALGLWMFEVRRALSTHLTTLYRPCLGSLAVALSSIAALAMFVLSSRAMVWPPLAVLSGGLLSGALAWLWAAMASNHPAYLELSQLARNWRNRRTSVAQSERSAG